MAARMEEEPEEMVASVTICMYTTLYVVVLRSLLNYEMSIIARLA